MRKLSILFSFIFILLTCMQYSCHSPTAPKGNNPPPDTTSNNFAWQVDTIGAEGSVLYDCVVINDTLAYIIGKIIPSDSIGRNNTNYWYNAAKWNGKEWTKIQIPIYYQGKKVFSNAYSVFARSANDIWFGLGYLVHWNGKSYSQVDPQLQSVENRIWESVNGTQLYVVGNYGNISYSSNQGSSWHKVQTGTTLPFQDIWGDGAQVLAVASDKFGLGGKYLVSLNGNTATTLNDSIPTAVSLSGIWFKANKEYYLVGDGIFEKQNFNQSVWNFDPFIRKIKYYQYAVCGNNISDVFISGEGGTVSHFNGKRWYTYGDIQNTNDRLRSVSMKGNVVIAVGNRYIDYLHNYGVIYLGRR